MTYMVSSNRGRGREAAMCLENPKIAAMAVAMGGGGSGQAYAGNIHHSSGAADAQS